MDGKYILPLWLCVRMYGDSAGIVKKIYEFGSLDTYIAFQPVPSARPAERASYWTLGTRKCCWVYYVWRAEFPDDWQLRDDPWKRHRPSESVCCPSAILPMAPVDLWKWKIEMKCAAKLEAQNWNCNEFLEMENFCGAILSENFCRISDLHWNRDVN